MLQKMDLPERAQAISLELAKQMFPGYQALVVTHTDGHNESGNIHTHIVINSVRKSAVERQPYMDKPHEEAAGYKHRSTDKFMNTLQCISDCSKTQTLLQEVPGPCHQV